MPIQPMKTTNLLITLATALFCLNSQAYGPAGHKLIGNIAQQLLTGKPAEPQVQALLDGMTLGEAALLGDEIKGWDQTPPREADAFHIFPRASGNDRRRYVGPKFVQ
jgi:hypothetical protein